MNNRHNVTPPRVAWTLAACAALGLLLVATGCSRKTPKEQLRDAMKQGDMTEAETLLRRGANINEADSHGRTLLHEAAFLGRAPVAQFLLDRGADTMARTPEGYTPLHIAAFKGNLAVAELLIKHGVDVNATDHRQGFTPLDSAKDEAMKSLLRNHGGKTSADLR